MHCCAGLLGAAPERQVDAIPAVAPRVHARQVFQESGRDDEVGAGWRPQELQKCLCGALQNSSPSSLCWGVRLASFCVALHRRE
eukprot:1844298-Pyramimonas_sp.AAC.1